MEIDGANPETAHDSGPHFDAMKNSFESFQKALKKAAIYEKEQRLLSKKRSSLQCLTCSNRI